MNHHTNYKLNRKGSDHKYNNLHIQVLVLVLSVLMQKQAFGYKFNHHGVVCSYS